MSEFVIRPYESSDRQAIFKIGADTAYFGDPVEAYMDDRRLFFDGFYRYYTDLEPEHGWVACANGQVVGFLTGCVDTAARSRRWTQKILPGLIWRALYGGYHVGKRTWRYALKTAGAALQGDFPHVDLKVYPAHLHINLDAAWRGQGLGRRLMEAYLDQLRRLRAPGVHLETTNLNEAACRLYERVGFRLLNACPAHIWKDVFKRPVENRAYGLRFSY